MIWECAMISEKKDLKGVLEPELTSDEIGPEPLTLFDEPEEEPEGSSGEKGTLEPDQEMDPEQLIQNGLSFISGLVRTFSDPEAAKALVSTIVKKDDHDGKTYLKIPVESEKTVENVLSMIGNLVKNMGS